MADVLTYLWTSNGGGAFANAAAKDTTWTAPTGAANDETITLTLTVTDSGGLTDSATVQVEVNVPPPTATAPVDVPPPPR